MSKSWRKSKTLVPNFKNPSPRVCPPTRFFDQMSYIGDEVVGCFLIETQKGLVLLDCMNPDERCSGLIEDGARELDLDLNNLCAIIISHGHGDHFGRAGYFKEKYHAPIYISETDYKMAASLPEGAPWKAVTFTPDHFLTDGEELDFGDIKIKAVLTPGHTEGCFSFIIPVTDEGRPHMAALWGGSGVLPSSDKKAYYESLLKFSKITAEYHVDAEIATHPTLDMGLERYALVRNITDGVPNPFVLGEEGYRYYEKLFYGYVKDLWQK